MVPREAFLLAHHRRYCLFGMMTSAPARLVLGPLLRHVGDDEATLWVETDRACTVEVLGCSSATFCVAGHHYGFVCVSGLKAGTCIPYEVRLDGERCWPLADSPFPPSVIRTRTPGAPVRLVFGSCRVTLPHEPPYTLSKDRDDRGREVDALLALVARLRTRSPQEWPDALLLLGDQIYADQVSPETERLIEERRPSGDASADDPPPGDVADFEEYTWLYREAWSDPATRWLLSTVASAMIFDDHDVHDDWNTSWQWVREIRTVPWWHERILGAYISYWIYQQLGNLSPAELAENALLARVREAQDAEGSCVRSRNRPRRRSRERAGATVGTSDARGCSCWIPVPAASSTRTVARCSPRTSGRGSRIVSPAILTTC
jgi:hypothetical protein